MKQLFKSFRKPLLWAGLLLSIIATSFFFVQTEQYRTLSASFYTVHIWEKLVSMINSCFVAAEYTSIPSEQVLYYFDTLEGDVFENSLYSDVYNQQISSSILAQAAGYQTGSRQPKASSASKIKQAQQTINGAFPRHLLLVYENNEWSIRGHLAPIFTSANLNTRLYHANRSPQHTASFAAFLVPELVYMKWEDTFSQAYQSNQYQALLAAQIALGLACAFALLLMLLAGRRKDGTLHLYCIDRLPADIFLLLLAALPLIIYSLNTKLYYISIQPLFQTWSFVATLSAGSICALMLLMCLIRKAKAGILWQHSPIARVAAWCKGLLCGDFLTCAAPFSRRITWRLVALSILYVITGTLVIIMTASLFESYALFAFIPVLCAGLGTIYLIRRSHHDTKQLDHLLTQLEYAAQNDEIAPMLAQDSLFYPFSQNISALQERVADSTAQRVKNERMKLDLITNVSHDLKTPLTSIISYLDLLQKNPSEQDRTEYLEILRRKAERLNDTVSDLFILAKSTSGAEPCELDSLNLVTAVRQLLTDLDDQISTASAQLKLTLPSEAWVLAEPIKLYRILQNLIDNALRYSLDGTRIFLTINTDQAEHTLLTIKNTASYEINFTPEEIMQRFVRGDTARTTEGSGLGLSIAESFMHNFNGDFSVSIDGDQFITQCTFVAQAPPASVS